MPVHIPGMEQSILIKTGMEFRGTTDVLGQGIPISHSSFLQLCEKPPEIFFVIDSKINLNQNLAMCWGEKKRFPIVLLIECFYDVGIFEFGKICLSGNYILSVD